MALRPITMLWLGTLLVLSAGCASTPPDAQRQERIADGALLIVVDDPRGERRRRGVGPGYRVAQAYADDPILARTTAALAKDYGLSVLEQWPLQNLGVHCFVVSRPDQSVVDAMSTDQRVKWLQTFNEFDLQTSAPTTGITSADPDCLLCRFARDVDSLGHGVRIAVIDTAVDTSHPDLRDSRVDVRNFAGRRGNPTEEKHGTTVVGLIAARASGPKGLNGAAPEARVHALRGCWQGGQGKDQSHDQGRCNTLTLALALDAAIELEPDVLNLSLTGKRDRVLDELVDVLLSRGTVVVAAYDETRASDDRFPARRPGVIYAYGVARDQAADVPHDDVVFGPRHAVSLSPMAGYDLVTGHSIATPHVAAMAARLLGEYEGASRDRVLAELTAWLEGYYNDTATAMRPH